MKDYLLAAWRTAQFTFAIIGVFALIFGVAFAIVIGVGWLILHFGGDAAMNAVTALLAVGMFIWLFVIPVVDGYKANLRKIRKEKENAQVSVD